MVMRAVMVPEGVCSQYWPRVRMFDAVVDERGQVAVALEDGGLDDAVVERPGVAAVGESDGLVDGNGGDFGGVGALGGGGGGEEEGDGGGGGGKEDLGLLMADLSNHLMKLFLEARRRIAGWGELVKRGGGRVKPQTREKIRGPMRREVRRERWTGGCSGWR